MRPVLSKWLPAPSSSPPAYEDRTFTPVLSAPVPPSGKVVEAPVALIVYEPDESIRNFELLFRSRRSISGPAPRTRIAGEAVLLDSTDTAEPLPDRAP